MKNTVPIVINCKHSTYVTYGRLVKIGVLNNCFAVTPNHDYFGSKYVLTHLATGFAVPESSANSIVETIQRAKASIIKVGKEKYERICQDAIDQHGEKIAAAYKALKLV